MAFGKGLAADEQHVALHLRRLRSPGADAEPGRLGAHRGDEGAAGFGGVGSELRSVHLSALDSSEVVRAHRPPVVRILAFR